MSALFSHPLHSFLLRTAPFDVRHEPHSAPHPNAPNHLAVSTNPHLSTIPSDGAHASESSIPDMPSEVVPTSHSNQKAKTGTSAPPSTLTARAKASQAASVGWKRTSTTHTEEDAPEHEYYSYRDISWGQSVVRMHRFLTGREELGVKPVYGLTA